MPTNGRYRLPDFLAIGPGRTATTWLHYVLEGVTDLPANIKETRFFAASYYRGIDWYAWHFRHARGDRPVGEVCGYFGKPHTCARVKLHLPDCRVICTLRDPVDRLYSNYKMMLYNAWVRGSLMDNLDAEGSMVQVNHYASHLAEWLDAFGRERVLVLFFDELQKDRQAYLDQICDFIGAARVDLANQKVPSEGVGAFARAPKNRGLAKRARKFREWLRIHDFYRTREFLTSAGVWRFCGGRGEKFPPLTAEEDAIVRQWFLPDVEALEQLLGCDLTRWKTPRQAGNKQRGAAEAGAPGNAPQTASA